MASASDIVETGGFRVGRNAWLHIFGSWGLGVLEVAPEHLVFDVAWKRYTFTRERIVRLLLRRGFWFRGLRIEHCVPEYPRFMLFQSLRVDRLKQHLEDAGYVVHDEMA